MEKREKLFKINESVLTMNWFHLDITFFWLITEIESDLFRKSLGISCFIAVLRIAERNSAVGVEHDVDWNWCSTTISDGNVASTVERREERTATVSCERTESTEGLVVCETRVGSADSDFDWIDIEPSGAFLLIGWAQSDVHFDPGVVSEHG